MFAGNFPQASLQIIHFNFQPFIDFSFRNLFHSCCDNIQGSMSL